MAETQEYGGRAVGDFRQWWGHCDGCGAGITVEAVDTQKLPDTDVWESLGTIDCPICDGNCNLGVVD